jgi:curved DNA-binding protein CbpA
METKDKFVDYYEILGVWPTADANVIKKAYFKLARMHHPDVVGKPGGDVGDSQVEVDFSLINEAFSVLSDEVKRRNFDQRLKSRAPTDTEHKDADRRSAQLAYEQARTAMKHNRYDKAVVLLKSAVKYDDTNPSYHSWYGFALAVLKTHLHEARDACKRALEMEFYNADYHANLGFVYHQAGLTSTANECFVEALKWDPEHPVATKYYTGGKVKQAENHGNLGGIFSFLKRPKETNGPKAKQRPGKAASARKR